MKPVKFEVLLMLTIIGVATACNQPQTKDAPSANNGVSLIEATLEGDELIKTNFGDIQLNQSYITKESIAKLNDQLSLQRAIEVYQWSLPVTTFQMWYNAHAEVYGGGDLDFVEYKSFNEKAGIPASNFWALTLYSENTRCFIDNKNATDKLRATSVDSRDKNLVINADGSVDLYVGPKAPEGKESNWLQTNVGEGWFPLFRTYGTEQAYFDKLWKPWEFELME